MALPLDDQSQPQFSWAENTWDIIDSNFKDNPEVHITHQLESYNTMIESLVPAMIQRNMPIKAYTPGADGSAKSSISMRVLRVGVSKPVQYVDRQYRHMPPRTARNLNLSYSAPMYLDLEITMEKGGKIDTHVEERVHLCKMPIMVGSKYCHLYGLNDKQLAAMNECPMDRGGYFIVNGGEKVIISQERPVENSITVFPENDENKPYVARAEVKSTIDQRFFPIKTTIVRLTRQSHSTRPSQVAKRGVHGQRLLVFLPYGEQPVPLFILFKALGVLSDRDIIEYLTDAKDDDIVSLLVSSAYDGQQVTTQAEALSFVAGCLKIRLDGAEGTPEQLEAMRLRYAQDILDREFLPHTGNNISKKLRFLSLMVNNLLQAYLNPALYTDRDKLTNKRLDLPGTLLGQIFRYWWQRLAKDIKVQFVKELKQSGMASNPTTIITLGQSVRRIIQKCGIENKLKYALSTGNWVTTRTHANSASKKGISQVLQRLSYLGTLSHKRRIMSPLERAGSKHEPPRRYHGTQPPKICPNETPEGAQVGTVKNLSLMTHVTIETSARPVIYCLQQLGMIAIEEAPSAAVHACVKILVNGDFVGLAPPGLRATMEMYRTLKCLKLSGRISKYASIAWHQDFRLIVIYTDGGRYSHPYYMIDEDNHFHMDRLLRFYDGDARRMLNAHNYASLSSRLSVLESAEPRAADVAKCMAAIKELTSPSKDGERPLNGCYEVPGRYLSMAVIEHLDTNEEETAMIAVMPDELYDARTYRRGRDGNYYGNLTRQLELPSDVGPGDDITRLVMAQLPEGLRASVAATCQRVIILRKKDRFIRLNVVQDGAGAPMALTDSAKLIIGNLNRFLSGTYITHTHCMLHPALINGVVATNIPFSDHNQSPRNCYQSSMGKQAIGMFATNYNGRMDTMASIMIYPQRPVVATRTAMYTGMSKLYHGYMSMHGIACISGYNQEDSLLSNGDSAKRGAFDICFYRTYTNKLQKLSSTDAGGERFDIPPERTIGRKAGSASEDRYHAINRNTSSRRPKLPYVGAVVGPGDILIPKYRSLAGKKDRGTDVLYTDSSTTMRATETGMVDLLMPSDEMTHYEDEDGYQIAKVRICELRMEEIGDKFASRSAQKGTVGMHYNSADMIFSQDGTSPDKIMNAQAIPSRMTIGQLIEALASKEGILRGRFHDATPFTEFNVDEIKENIEEMGYDCCGDEIMYNGLTGEVMDVPIFFNPTYYQRLKHMVADKMHARNLGPIQALTKQPAEGRSRAGGLRLGEMERDCMIAHGAASVLKEKLVDSSDIFEVFISKQRKTIIAANPQLGVFQQGARDIYGTDDIYKLHIPYALNLFRNELRAAMVDMQMEVE